MLEIAEGISVFINSGGGVTLARSSEGQHPEVIHASHTPEAAMLYAILEHLRGQAGKMP